jgi:cellulose synthase/poly-beta-1,6-N-acetylglucosamine synthase-like glycosyltransferase
MSAKTAARPVRPVAAPKPGTDLVAALDHGRDVSTFAVHLVSPELSAVQTVTFGQRLGFLAVVGVLIAALVARPLPTLTTLVGLATLMYVLAFAYRMWLYRSSLGDAELIRVSDEEARAVPKWRLPMYTILIPAYKEPEVIGHLIESIAAIEYPRERLDVKLLLEEDDLETYQAVLVANPGPEFDIIRVPRSEPRTKPKACNVGLAAARGQLVTIYDAEDRPEPLQLRRAVVAFSRAPSDVACMQAKLSYHNADQNLITRWFTAEYAMWFGQLLPALVRQHAPLPLGGTSNHFHRQTLIDAGGWDPWNVTEDADLGIRLSRLGFRAEVLESVTLEEANSDFVNWVKQRSRWYKGYLQTWLVHMRHPIQLVRELGLVGVVSFTLFVLGTPLLAMLNPVFWALTAVWFLARPEVVATLFPAWIYYLGMFCLVAGNSAFLYMSMVSARSLGRPSLVIAAILSPIYWMMMSVAAIKAGVQLIAAPSFWEKTTHGLTVRPPVDGGTGVG